MYQQNLYKYQCARKKVCEFICCKGNFRNFVLLLFVNNHIV